MCTTRSSSDVALIDPTNAWHVGGDNMVGDETMSDEERPVSRSRDGSLPTGRAATVSNVTADSTAFTDGAPDLLDR